MFQYVLCLETLYIKRKVLCFLFFEAKKDRNP